MDSSSILFSPKEAQRVSTQSIYAMGRNGIMELIRIDDRFSRFEDSLFGTKMSSVDRMLLNEEENRNIDEQVRDYLFSVAPYMLLKSVQKTLEYLIRRFSIHTFNAEDFFLAVLPYHETALFARVFKICDLKSHLFDFLVNVKKAGTPIIRSSLSNQCLKDFSFLEFILNGLRNLNEHSAIPVVHLTLLCSIVVDITRSGQLQEEYVRALIAFASKGFASANSEFQATAFLILAQVAVNVSLSNDIITACLNNILRNKDCNMSQLVECLLLLFRNNASYSLPVETASSFLANSIFESSLDRLAKKVSVFPVIAALAPAHCRLLLADGSYLRQLSAIPAYLRPAESADYVALYLDQMAALVTPKLSAAEKENTQKALLALSSQFPEAFDLHMTQLANDLPLKELATAVFYGSSHMLLKNGRSLLLSVESSDKETQSEVCELLLSQLADMNPSEKEFTRNSLAALMKGGDVTLLARIVDAKDALLQAFSEEELVTVLLEVLTQFWEQKRVQDERFVPVFESIFAFLQTRSLASLQPQPALEALHLFFVFLLECPSDACRASLCALVAALPCAFSKACHLKPTQSLRAMVKTVTGVLVTLPNDAVITLYRGMVGRNASVTLFFSFALLRYMTQAKNASACAQLACLFTDYAEKVLVELKPEVANRVRLAASDFASLKGEALIGDTLEYSDVDRAVLLMKMMYLVSSEVAWDMDHVMTDFGAVLAQSAHPYSLLCFCFTSFTPQKSAFMVLANSVCSHVWKTQPWTPFVTLLSCSTETPIIVHSLNKLAGLLPEMKIDYAFFGTLVMSVVQHLGNPVMGVRSTALLVLDVVRKSVMNETMNSEKKRRNSMEKSESKIADEASRDVLDDGEKTVILVEFIQYLLSYRSDIRDDAKLLAIKLNVLLKASRPAIPVMSLSASLLPLILACPTRAQRVGYLRLFSNLPYHASSEAVVFDACRRVYDEFRAASKQPQGKNVVAAQLVEEWQCVLALFFKAMAQTTERSGEFREFVYAMMHEECVVLVDAQPYSIMTDVLHAMMPDVFASMNPTERLAWVHGLLLLVPSHPSIDALDIYNAINQFDVSLGLLVDEGKSIAALPIGTEAEERFAIQMMTALVEVITRNPRFRNSVQVVDVLLLLLKRLVAILRAHAPKKESAMAEEQRATDGTMTLEDVETTTVVSDSLSVFYPVQIVLESLYSIVNTCSQGEEVITPEDRAKPQPGSKRLRRNSVSIQTEINIPPQLLVELIQFNLTTQIKKACLQLLSLLASLHQAATDSCLFACFEDLAHSVIHNQDEESFAVITSIISYCLRRFTNTEQLLRIYKIFLSCVPYIPYSQSVVLLNGLFNNSSLRYVGHITLYLLLLNHGVSIRDPSAMEEEPSTKKQLSKRKRSLAANSTRFVTAMFLEISLNSQIQALGVLCCFAEMLTAQADAAPRKMNRTRELSTSLMESLPVAEWNTFDVVNVCRVVIEFVRDIISNQAFINKVVTATKDVEVIQQFFIQIIEHLLLLLQNATLRKEAVGEAARGRSKTKEEVGLIRVYRELELSLYDCVTVFSEVMSVKSLLSVLSVLVRHDDSNLRKRALIILNKKISEGIEDLSEDDCNEYIEFVSNLVAICDNEKESSANRQTALLSLHVLVQFFAADYPDAFIPAIHTVVKIVTQTVSAKSDEQALKGSAYIALSMMCSQLGAKMIPFLPKVLPPLLRDLGATCERLQSLQEEIELLEEEAEATVVQDRQNQLDEAFVLTQGLISSLTSVVTYQGSLLSAYLRQMLVVVLSPVLVASKRQVIVGAIRVLFTLLSENISERVLLPAIYDASKEIDRDAAASLCGLYELLKCVCDTLSEEKMKNCYERMWAFCVTGLETRSRWDAAREDVDAVEKTVVAAMVAMALKLNEVQLTSLLMKTVSWMEEKSVSNVDVTGEGKHVTEQDLPPTSKAIPVFTLVVELSETFKSIFTPFYGQFFQTMVNFVAASNKAFHKEKRSEEGALLFKLVKTVVLAFYKCFLYNTEGWIDEEKFRMAATPLVKMIGAYFVPDYAQEYPKFMSSYVVPTVVQLVVCTSGHDDWWQSFNHEVLIQTRSPLKEVKLAAMKVIHECFARMSQEYLPLLPDTIPYLADLLEDEDAEVEKAAQDLRVQLESVSGEELTSYLTMWRVCWKKEERAQRE